MANGSYLAGLRSILLSATLTPNPNWIGPPPVMPDAAFPCITMSHLPSVEIESHDGLSGLTDAIMQVNIWSPSYDDAFALRQSVMDRLSTFRGTVADVGLSLDGATDFRQTELFDPDRQLHQLILRCHCWWVR